MAKERLINGVVYEFPDHTSEEVIDRFEAQKLGKAPGGIRPQRAPTAKPEPFLTGFPGALAQGLTMGFSDEAIARARALGGGDYSEYLKAEREGLRKYGEEHPVKSTIGEVTGAAVPAVLTAGASLAPQVLTRVGPKMAQILFGSSPSILRAMGYGAGQGAITAAGTTEKEGLDIGPEMVKGAASGALLTGGLGVLGKYALSPAFKSLKSAMGFTDDNKAADIVIARALQKDGKTPDQALAALQAAKRGEMTLADIGDATAALLRRSSQAPGPAREATKSALIDRETGRVPRIADDLRTLMSASRDFYTDIQDLMAKRRTTANSLYEQAWSNAQQFTPQNSRDLAKLSNLPSFKQALVQGQRRMEDQGLDITDPKNVLRGLHETKLALDDMIDAQTDSLTRKVSHQGVTYIDMRNRLIKEMEKRSPEYRQARLQYAGDSEMLDAMEKGRRVYTTPELMVRREMVDFAGNPSVYDAYRAGIAQSMLERLRAAGGAVDPMKAIFPKDSEARIRQVFKDDQAFEEFKSRLLEESKMLGTEKAAFRRTPTDTDLQAGAASGVGAARALAQGRPGQAILEGLQAAFPRITGMPEQQAQKVSSVLTTPTSGLDPLIESIMRNLKQEEAALASKSTLANVAGALGGGQAGAREPKPQYPEETEGRADAPPSPPVVSPLTSMR